MNTSTASGSCRLISRAPATSISSTTLSPSASRRSTSLRSVPYRLPAKVTCSRNSPSLDRRSNSSARGSGTRGPSLLAGALRPGGGRRRQRQPRARGREPARSACPCPRRTGRTRRTAGRSREPPPVGQERNRSTSSPRWRSDSPPMVLAWLIRHWVSSSPGAHPSQPRNGQQHVVHLRRQHVVRRVDQHLVEVVSPDLSARFSCARCTRMLVRPVECLESLVERTGGGLGEERGHRAGRLYHAWPSVQRQRNGLNRPIQGWFASTSSRALPWW